MQRPRNIKVGSRWVYKNSKKKLVVKIFEIETWKIDGKKHVVIVYGLTKSLAGHISQSVGGFLDSYERES